MFPLSPPVVMTNFYILLLISTVRQPHLLIERTYWVAR